MQRRSTLKAQHSSSSVGPQIRRRTLGLGLLLAIFLTIVASARGAQTTEVQYLSGHGKDDTVPWNFFCTRGANAGYWTNLPVPSQWDVQGFGTLHYRRDMTNSLDEKGLYKHGFIVPKNWSARRIFLVFDGVMTDTDAKLNGQSVGPVHQGGYYRFKYEVTPLVKFGATNLLEVTVAKHSANRSINNAERNADFWVFGGIYRPVSLEAVPPAFIDRVAINAKADGSFAADVYVDGVTNAGEVEVQIQTLGGKKVGPAFKARAHDSTNAPAVRPLRATTQIPSPKLWTAETPNLYQAVFRLKKSGHVLHEYRQRFGFRTMEVRNSDGLYVNGHKVILRGINRHSFWPESGRTLSTAVQLLDINTLKDANINAVRMSHYPPDAEFLDLCDEKGLYVLDELTGWHQYYDNDVGPKLVKEMVVRDVNHPCILFWDNGNEGGFNTNLDKLFGDYDPQQRRVLHPWAGFSGLCTAHYLGYDKAEIAATGKRVYYSKNKDLVATNDPVQYIYMPTEFSHALYDGGGGAGLDDYWHMMMSHPLCAGGFIWAYTDDGIKRPDSGKIDVAGNEAPDGVVGPYRQREGSYYAIKDIWSPIQITRGSNGVFQVENRYNFTDAHDCKFSWELRKFASPTVTSGSYTVVRSGVLDSPSIPPGGTGTFEVSAASRKADALALRADDPTGRELWTWIWPLREMTEVDRLTQKPARHHPTLLETNGIISITTGKMTATFSKSSGLLLGVQQGKQAFSLTNGPRLAAGTARLDQISFGDHGPDAFVYAHYDGDLKSVLWRLNGNGWINCDYVYSAKGTNDYLGVLFDYPESLVTHKRWLGQGPYHVWKNRLRGTTLGIWENDYNNTITGWSDWVYPEFKGFFAAVRWLQLQTKEGQITVLNNSAVPYLQVLTPEFPPTNLIVKAIAPMPKCGLGFMDMIPPIGTKGKDSSSGGPQSQPNVANGEYSGSVSFYFGKLPPVP